MAQGEPAAAHRPSDPSRSQRDAAALFGLWFAVVVVKFGNPVIFASRDGQGRAHDLLLQPPDSLREFLIASWPLSWSCALIGLAGLAALFVWRWKAPGPK